MGTEDTSGLIITVIFVPEVRGTKQGCLSPGKKTAIKKKIKTHVNIQDSRRVEATQVFIDG